MAKFLQKGSIKERKNWKGRRLSIQKVPPLPLLGAVITLTTLILMLVNMEKVDLHYAMWVPLVLAGIVMVYLGLHIKLTDKR